MLTMIVLAQSEAVQEVTLDWLTRGGMIGILASIVIAFLREWVVPGTTYKRMEADRDAWKTYALRSLGAAEKTVTLADKDGFP